MASRFTPDLCLYSTLKLEMGDSDEQVCRLCLEKGPACECGSIDKIKKEMLEALLVNINFDISESENGNEPENPTVKNECLELENDVSEVNIEKNEDNAVIKHEELHIKDELGSGEEIDLSPPFPSKSALEAEDCDGCDGSSKWKSGTRKCLSKEEQPHFCPKCPFSTKWKKNLERHKLTHSDRRPDRQSSSELPELECHSCDYKTKIRASLNRHISTIHEREKATVYSCQQCMFKTVHAGVLPRHLAIHGEKILHKCPGCKKAFSDKKALDDHLLKQHDDLRHLIGSKIYGCDFCAYRSTKPTNVKNHITVKHDRVNAEKFQCHNCAYCAVQKSHLKRHLLTHLNLRPHRCSACKKGFNHKGILDVHIVTKHKDDAELVKTVTRKIYQCASCTYKSVYKSVLHRHIKQNHK